TDASEHVDVLPDDAVTDVGGAEGLRRPRTRQGSDLHVGSAWDDRAIDCDCADSQRIPGSIERTGVRAMPSFRVITERPTEARDAPAFRTNLVKEFLTETDIADTLDGNLFGSVRQLVFARDIVAGDIPAIRTS